MINRRKVLLGSALLCASLPMSAFATPTPETYALPDDLPYDDIVAVNDAFNFLIEHEFALKERAQVFGLGSYGYRPTGVLRDMVLTHVIDNGNRVLLERARNIGIIAHELDVRFRGNRYAQRVFVDASYGMFRFTGMSLRELMTTGHELSLSRAANILAWHREMDTHLLL